MDDVMNEYNMQENQKLYVDGGNTIIKRVPGGWVHIMYLDRDRAVAAFVPYNEEFKEGSK